VLVDQLAEGGRLVLPVGPARAQNLQIVQRIDLGVRVSVAFPVRFPPMVNASSPAPADSRTAADDSPPGTGH
jgi:protein-L-isoaspartate O-methyltransferase